MWCNVAELAGENNLAFKIAERLRRTFQPETGIEIQLHKRIPLAAGLGGGSSDAANVLLTLNQLWNLNLDIRDLETMAAEFGSDIGFFLQGGTAWGTHRGERIETLADIAIDNILLVYPNLEISAAQAYKAVRIPSSDDVRTFRPEAWRETCFNRLETGIRSEFAEVDGVIRKMRQMGAKPALMSGSGSTCFGIFDNADELTTCQQCFNQAGYWTMKVKTMTRNEYQSVFKA